MKAGDFKMNTLFNANCEQELYHYGVLGMKWGVRKGKTYGSKIKNGTVTIRT